MSGNIPNTLPAHLESTAATIRATGGAVAIIGPAVELVLEYITDNNLPNDDRGRAAAVAAFGSDYRERLGSIAREGRKRLISMGELASLATSMSDEAVADRFLTCTQCGNRIVSDDDAYLIIASSETAEEFFDELAWMAHEHDGP